jgi:large subunit ribosomal protein L5
MYTPVLKTRYKEEIIPALMKEFSYTTVMQVPRLEKIVLNQGVGQAIADKKLLEFSVKELTDIAGQKAVQEKYAYRSNGDIAQGQDVRIPRKAYQRCLA